MRSSFVAAALAWLALPAALAGPPSRNQQAACFEALVLLKASAFCSSYANIKDVTKTSTPAAVQTTLTQTTTSVSTVTTTQQNTAPTQTITAVAQTVQVTVTLPTQTYTVGTLTGTVTSTETQAANTFTNTVLTTTVTTITPPPDFTTTIITTFTSTPTFTVFSPYGAGSRKRDENRQLEARHVSIPRPIYIFPSAIISSACLQYVKPKTTTTTLMPVTNTAYTTATSTSITTQTVQQTSTPSTTVTPTSTVTQTSSPFINVYASATSTLTISETPIVTVDSTSTSTQSVTLEQKTNTLTSTVSLAAPTQTVNAVAPCAPLSGPNNAANGYGVRYGNRQDTTSGPASQSYTGCCNYCYTQTNQCVEFVYSPGGKTCAVYQKGSSSSFSSTPNCPNGGGIGYYYPGTAFYVGGGPCGQLALSS